MKAGTKLSKICIENTSPSQFMRSLFLLLATSTALSSPAASVESDLCIYGGTSAGVIAADMLTELAKHRMPEGVRATYMSEIARQ